ALITQLRMDAWASITAFVRLSRHGDILYQSGIFSAVLTGLAFAPGRRPADRYLQHTTHHRNWILSRISSDKVILQTYAREKMPSAFFNISRSCRSISFSRFK